MNSFFDVLVDVLGLTRATLLLDSRLDQTFRPWASLGFDSTSIAQLCIPVSGIPYSPDAYLLDSPRKLPVSHLFSGKDYASMEILLIMPIKTGKVISGLLIIADNPYLGLTKTERDMIFHPVQDLLRRAIQTHHDFCTVPSGLEPVLLSELSGNNNLRMSLIEARKSGILINFSYSDLAALGSAESRSLTSHAINLDLRYRLISNLQRSIIRSFSAPGHDYLWLKPESADSIEDLLDLAATDLSINIVANETYTSQVRDCFTIISMDAFMRDNLAFSAA